VDKDLAYELLAGEQADFVEAVRALDDTQWATASLCDGWDVHDVTVHAACGRKSLWSGLKLWASVGFGSPHKVNAKEVADHRSMPSDDLVSWLATPITKKSSTDTLNQLRGLMIHQQDVRRPLQLTREIPRERLIAVLELGLTRIGDLNLGSRKRAAGLRLVASDIDWVHGDGPEVQGSGEAILMSLAGRRAALADLSGAGVVQLTAPS
jgi:uncharacterized protein (TIGR03083 family)